MPAWIDNILVPSPDWGVSVTVTNLNQGSQPGGRYGCVSFLWYGAVPARPAYAPRSPENTRAAPSRVWDDLLWENLLARFQSLSNSCSIFCDNLVNRSCLAWDDIWDELVDESFLWGNFLWIAVWIAFCVIFLWIIDFRLNHQFIECIYSFCQACSNKFSSHLSY